MHINIYTDKAGDRRWNLVSGSDIIADGSQGYSRRIDLVSSLESALGGKVNLTSTAAKDSSDGEDFGALSGLTRTVTLVTDGTAGLTTQRIEIRLS